MKLPTTNRGLIKRSERINIGKTQLSTLKQESNNASVKWDEENVEERNKIWNSTLTRSLYHSTGHDKEQPDYLENKLVKKDRNVQVLVHNSPSQFIPTTTTKKTTSPPSV